MLILISRLPPNPGIEGVATLSLTAAERMRSRHRFTADNGQPVYLSLPRGTVLRGQDLVATEEGICVRILAKPEAVLTVTAADSLQLLRAAYHLGNRHVALEITPQYLRLEPDSVLEGMLHQLGVQVTADVVPFEPEVGAYGHSHASRNPEAHPHSVHQAHHD